MTGSWASDFGRQLNASHRNCIFSRFGEALWSLSETLRRLQDTVWEAAAVSWDALG